MNKHFAWFKSLKFGCYDGAILRWNLSKRSVEEMLRRSPLPVPLTVNFDPDQVIGRVIDCYVEDDELMVIAEIDGRDRLSMARKFSHAMPSILEVDTPTLREFGLTNRPAVPTQAVSALIMPEDNE